LVKRTRRNLSDPRIKKIIKSQLPSPTGISKSSHRNSPEGGPIKLLFFFVLFLFITVSGLLLYLNWSDINHFFDSTFSSSSISGDQINNDPSSASPPVSVGEPGTNADNENPPEKQVLQPVSRSLQIEVLNGCGKEGLARDITYYLRQKDIDVVSQGNYVNFNVRKSMIIDRVDDPEKIKMLAKILGISPDQIQVKVEPSLQLDATVVLGKDYESLRPFNN
jgi:hypothetical protein